MSVSSSSIEIDAAPATIFTYADATERWPLILPHYRYVRVLERRDAMRVVEMAAWCDVFPLRWVAEQTTDARRPHIAFRHIAGPTRGMEVEWLFEPAGGRTRVTIVHRLDFDFPIAAAWFGKHLVAGYFIASVAQRTLRRIKQRAEADGAR